jgi:ATP/maltotriose-dependent transcriptional regulator MalT
MQLHQGIIVTKLYPPAARSGLIPRRRLSEMLIQRGLPRLALVTAAAGYGKTTLLAQWFDFLRRRDYHCAWFSVDRSDSDPAEFLRYLITGVRSGIADLGEESLRTLESRSQIDPGEIVIALINEIAKAGREIAVFLDDFHNIESGVVTEIVGAFIARGPSNLHFLLASRSIPDLPVASLRAHAEVVNISAEDLRFNADETAQFLRDARGLDLSDEQIDGLFDRTEGCVAGLQLASLSLDQTERRDAFIHSFSGEVRKVAEYLALDVLNRLPPDLQEFLLHTSILERMSAESCRCLVGRGDCQEALDYLEDSNTFLLPLDEKRTWYRYHHLFREFLLGQLKRRQPTAVRELYRRASRWFAAQGYDNEAVTYALESEDFDQAALLVEQHAARLLKRGQMPRLYRWLQEEMKVLRAGVACVHDDVEVLEQLASEPLREKLILPFHMSAMYNMLGYSRLVKGEFERAGDALAKSRRYHEKAGSSFGLAYCGIFSGMLNRIQGKLHSAAADFRQSEDISILDSGERSAGAAVARLMQGVVLYEWNRIDEAERLIAANIGLVEECTIAEALVLGYITLARIRFGQGRGDDAAQCYAKIRAICERGKSRRLLLLVENDFVRMLINQSDVASAERVASRLNIGLDGEPDHLTDRWESTACLEVLIRARILRARGQPDRALKDLQRLRNLAVKAGRMRVSIEILTLMALAEFERGARAAMGKKIATVLSLSPSSGFLRIFLDEGENVGPMLQWLQNHSGKELPASVGHQLQAILAACAECSHAAGNRDDRVAVRHGLAEELSPRELQVLELIVSGRSNEQIGEQLEIAESTVKWHAKNIFGKLWSEKSHLCRAGRTTTSAFRSQTPTLGGGSSLHPALLPGRDSP